MNPHSIDPYLHLYPDLEVSVFFDGHALEEPQVLSTAKACHINHLKWIPFSQIDERLPESGETMSHVYGYIGDNVVSAQRFIEFCEHILQQDHRPAFFMLTPAQEHPVTLSVQGKLIHIPDVSPAGFQSALIHASHKVFSAVQKEYWRQKWKELKQISDETHEEAFQFQQEQNDFIRLTKLLRTKLDSQDVVKTACTFFKEAFKLSESIFLRFDESSDALLYESSESTSESPLQIGVGLRGMRNPLAFFETFIQSAEFQNHFASAGQVKAFPVMAKELPIGVFVLCMQKEKAFPAHHLMDQLITYFGISYLNATLHEKITEMAVRDGLTGLYNVRYFHQRVSAEFNRLERLKAAMGLIFLDIDHFKTYNDTHGHPKGDLVLKQVAELIKKVFRPADIMARYGGEEFVVAMPHANLKDAQMRAEHLRRLVEETVFPDENTQPLGKVTISVGVSAFPELANDPQSLIKSADEALYEVKNASRNDVRVASAPKGHVPLYKPRTP